MTRLELNVTTAACFQAFYPLLQQGFWIEATGEATIRSLLAQRCGRNGDDALHDIQTIFLNGMPLDDPENVVLCDGDTLALSAALPGLVGATFRSGGILAGFRQSITYRPGATQGPSNGGRWRIKLFNALIPALGPGFLNHGIMIDFVQMRDLIKDLILLCGPAAQTTVCNGKPVPLDILISEDMPDPENPIVVKAHFDYSTARAALR